MFFNKFILFETKRSKRRMFFVEGRIMEIKRLSDQMISESFAKHAQDVYVLPASEVFYIYFRYGKNEHSGRKSLRQMDSN